MADTTMGQRIAERRRLLGISQEALGEKMGVSRQAISKWESDGAVPEIDKIITMSRLFGVSVGWILGTEEDSAKSENPVQEKEPRQTGKSFLWPGICLVLLGLALLLWFSQIQLRNRLENAEQILTRLQLESSQAEDALHALRTQIQALTDSAEKENTMFSQIYCSVAAADDAKQASVYVSLVPKKWSSGDQVELTAMLGGQKAAQQPCCWDGTAFSGELLLPAENGYQYYCTLIHADGSREQQSIANEQAENLARELQVSCSAGAGEYSLGVKAGVLTVNSAYVSLAMPRCLNGAGSEAVSWESVAFVLYKDGQEVDRLTPAGLLSQGDTSRTFHASVESLQLQFGESEENCDLELWVEAALSNGMTGKGFVDGWVMENGCVTGKLTVVDG